MLLRVELEDPTCCGQPWAMPCNGVARNSGGCGACVLICATRGNPCPSALAWQSNLSAPEVFHPLHHSGKLSLTARHPSRAFDSDLVPPRGQLWGPPSGPPSASCGPMTRKARPRARGSANRCCAVCAETSGADLAHAPSVTATSGALGPSSSWCATSRGSSQCCLWLRRRLLSPEMAAYFWYRT